MLENKGMCLGQVTVVGVLVLVINGHRFNGHCFNGREDHIIGQSHDPFGFVTGHAGDVFSEVCWGKSMDLLERLSFMLVDENAEDTVGPGLEWTSDCLDHGLGFSIGKATTLGVGLPKPIETSTSRSISKD
jgi:hypothetical protein